jgi:DNA-binding CsgD family transcriptional regulator
VRIGHIARIMGGDEFHVAVARLLGDMLHHDYKVIVRYPLGGLPDILFAQNFGPHLINYYLQHAYDTTDPFYGYWRATGRPGVVPLADALRYARDRDFYPRIYQPKLGISDEVAVMLPGMGGACLGIFLGRRETRFAKADIARVRLVFPCIEGLHRAHIGRLFARLVDGTRPRAAEPFPRPTLIVTRAGDQIYSNRAWRRATRKDPGIAKALVGLAGGRQRRLSLPNGTILHVERFGTDFALAPGGRMFALEPTGVAGDAVETGKRAADDFARLTPRERQIVHLIMEGASAGEMAKRLGLSKGTVKNHRLRIYKKLEVSSERALFLRFLPLTKDFRFAEPAASPD